MQRLEINQLEIQNQYSSCLTLVELLSTVEKQLAEYGRVVCEIWVNDQLVENESESQWQTMAIHEVESVRVVADHPESLIVGALESIYQAIPALEQACRQSAAKIREGQVQLGIQELGELFTACQWVTETLHHSRGAAKGTGSAFTTLESWISVERNFMSVLNELQLALQSQNYVFLADLLEYDLIDGLELWSPLVKAELEARQLSRP
jgi:hypothetical protein